MTVVLFILEAAALGAFLAGNPLGFVLWGTVCAAVLFSFVKGFTRLLAARTGDSAKTLTLKVLLALSPVCLLFLKYLSFFVFLKDIRGYLLPVALAGVLGLLYFSFAVGPKTVEAEARVPRRAWFWLFLISSAVYAFLASGLVFPRHPLTGDEPHYLLITKSLIDDGDINLANNYANKDYLRFYPRDLEPHAKPGRLGPDHQYSQHLPGLSVLLIPFYILGEKAGGLGAFVFLVRLPILLLTALLGAVFFLLVLDLTRNIRAALAGWLVFSFTSPVLFYSGLIYPEVPAALISLLVFRQLLFRKDGRPFAILLAGLGLASLPWFGTKYVILAVVLYILAALQYLKKPAVNLGQIFRLSIFPVVSAALFLFFLWWCFGHFNPVAAYTGADMPSSLSAIRPTRPTNLQTFAAAGLSPFFEQKAGVLVHAPVYFLAAAGIFLLWKRRRATAVQLLIVFGAYWLMGAAAYYLGGYSPPGRPLLPVIWILAAFVSVALAWPAGRLAALAKLGLAGSSILIAGFALFVPRLLYHLNIASRAGNVAPESDFLGAAGNLLFDPRKWAPSLSGSSTMGAWPLGAWVLALLLVTALILRPRKKASASGDSFRPAGRAMVVLAFSILFLAVVFFHVRLESPFPFKSEGYELYFQDSYQFGPERGGFWTRGAAETSVVLRSPSRLSKITLFLSSEVPGQAEVRADRFRASVRHDPIQAPEPKLVINSPSGFPWKGGYLYLIRVRERSAFVPRRLDPRKTDHRTLGVFVRIAGTRAG